MSPNAVAIRIRNVRQEKLVGNILEVADEDVWSAFLPQETVESPVRTKGAAAWVTAMLFSDLALSRRLERAEGYACAKFAEARRRVFPDCGAGWIKCAGTYAVFDGVDSPLTASFGLGLFEVLNPASLAIIESFFLDHGAQVSHEVIPFAPIATLELLCNRNYRPIEFSNVLFRGLEPAIPKHNDRIRIRIVGKEETQLWTNINAKGWTHECPELLQFLLQLGTISGACEQIVRFLAEFDGKPGAAGALCIHEGVGVLGGSATIPELRHRGLQTALVAERLRYAFEHGCDLTMMAAQPGSNSQHNGERHGFQIAYTRTKWRLRVSQG